MNKNYPEQTFLKASFKALDLDGKLFTIFISCQPFQHLSYQQLKKYICTQEIKYIALKIHS